MDRWAALQFDGAAAMVGQAIEAAAQEQINVGMKNNPKYENKYTLEQLLDPGFRLPAPAKRQGPAGVAGLMAIPGVKRFRQGAPA